MWSEALTCGYWFLGGVALFISFVVWSVISSQRENRRKHQEIISWAQEEREEQEQSEKLWDIASAWHGISVSFPFLAPPEPRSDDPQEVIQAISRRLFSVPSLGTFTSAGLPAPLLPPPERRRHLYVVGKTGSGKTTFLEHLIEKDIAAGHGVGVMAPEGELFRDKLLPLIPESRRPDVIYFAPGDLGCPLTFNPLQVEPGDDALRAAEDLFTIFRRALSKDELGPRMQPILQNAFAVLVGREAATLWDVKRLLTDEAFRRKVIRATRDPYIREFWEATFPRFAKGADLPLLSRLDHFLRPPAVRRSLCHPLSSFSIRQVLAERKILFIDLFGLSEETRALLGQMILSKFQIELMRRELAGNSPSTFFLYCDEFQTFAGFAEGVWRELLSRGRKYGLALTLAHQFPAQLPTALQEEIFGNVNSMVSFALGSKDAQVVRKEFLAEVEHGKEIRIEALPIEELLELPMGQAYAKLAGGRAVRITMPPPLVPPRSEFSLMLESWQRYAVSLMLPQGEESADPLPHDEAPPPPQEEKATAPKPEPPPTQAEPVAPAREQPTEASEVLPTPASPPMKPKSPPTPEPKASPKSPPVEPKRPGKGGPEHTYLQELIKRWGEEHGFRAAVEEQIAGGKESIDVALYRGDTRIACEVSVTTPLDYEVGNVQKCLAAGFGSVAVVSLKKKRLEQLGKLLSKSLPPEQRERVHLFTPEELLSWLAAQPIEEDAGTVRGYKVKVRYRDPGDDRLKRVGEILSRSLSGLKRDD